MKKLLVISSIFALMGIFNASNASDFKNVKSAGEGDGHCSLVEGSLSVISEKAPFRLVFDFSHANYAVLQKKNNKFVEPRPLDEYLAQKGEDVPENWTEVKESILSFSKEKISKEKAYKLYLDDKSPKYEMKIVVDNINFGNTGQTMAFRAFGVGGASFGGNMIITEIATGKVALNLRVDYAYSVSSMGYHYTVNKRLQCTFGDFFFGKYLPKVYKANK